MTADSVGRLFGALILIYLMSRVIRWFLRSKVGDGVGLILLSLAVSLVVSVAIGGRGLSDTSTPRFDLALSVYAPAALIWLFVDLLVLRGRQARKRETREATDG